MQHGPQSNAMTEIALALAMAFFSVMVLAMVSMGAGLGGLADTESAPDGPGIRLQPSHQSETAAAGASGVALAVYYEGALRDANLAPLAWTDPSLATLRILAIPPDLPIAEAIAVRERIPAADLDVTTLTDDWLQAAKEITR